MGWDGVDLLSVCSGSPLFTAPFTDDRRAGGDPQYAAERLVSAVLTSGKCTDNVTCVLVLLPDHVTAPGCPVIECPDLTMFLRVVRLSRAHCLLAPRQVEGSVNPAQESVSDSAMPAEST